MADAGHLAPYDSHNQGETRRNVSQRPGLPLPDESDLMNFCMSQEAHRGHVSEYFVRWTAHDNDGLFEVDRNPTWRNGPGRLRLAPRGQVARPKRAVALTSDDVQYVKYGRFDCWFCRAREGAPCQIIVVDTRWGSICQVTAQQNSLLDLQQRHADGWSVAFDNAGRSVKSERVDGSLPNRRWRRMPLDNYWPDEQMIMDRLPTYDPFDVDEVQEANEYYVSLVDEGGKFPQLRIRAGAGSRKNMTLTGTSQIVCVSYGNFDCWHTGGSLVQAVDTRTGTMTRTIQLEALPDLQSIIATRHDAALTDYGHETTPLSREIQCRIMPLRGRRRSRKDIRVQAFAGNISHDGTSPSHAQASASPYTSRNKSRSGRRQTSLDKPPVERFPDERSIAQHLWPHGPRPEQNLDEYHVASIVDDLSNTRWLQIQGNVFESLRLNGQPRVVCQSYGHLDCWYATTGPDVIAIDTRSGRVTRKFPLEQFADLQGKIRTRQGASLADYGREAPPLSERDRQRRSIPMRGRLLRDRDSEEQELGSHVLLTEARPSHSQASSFPGTPKGKARVSQIAGDVPIPQSSHDHRDDRVEGSSTTASSTATHRRQSRDRADPPPLRSAFLRNPWLARGEELRWDPRTKTGQDRMPPGFAVQLLQAQSELTAGAVWAERSGRRAAFSGSTKGGSAQLSYANPQSPPQQTSRQQSPGLESARSAERQSGAGTRVARSELPAAPETGRRSRSEFDLGDSPRVTSHGRRPAQRPTKPASYPDSQSTQSRAHIVLPSAAYAGSHKEYGNRPQRSASQVSASQQDINSDTKRQSKASRRHDIEERRIPVGQRAEASRFQTPITPLEDPDAREPRRRDSSGGHGQDIAQSVGHSRQSNTSRRNEYAGRRISRSHPRQSSRAGLENSSRSRQQQQRSSDEVLRREDRVDAERARTITLQKEMRRHESRVHFERQRQRERDDEEAAYRKQQEINRSERRRRRREPVQKPSRRHRFVEYMLGRTFKYDLAIGPWHRSR